MSGVLLLHGFGGSPGSLQPWADDLRARGYDVELPVLPGHGTRWQDLARVAWTDWYAAAEQALDRLAARTEAVAVGGISLGGALALRLAAQRRDDVRAVVLVNPRLDDASRFLFAVPVLKHVVRSIPNVGTEVNRPGAPTVSYERVPVAGVHEVMKLWKDVRPRLDEVHQPVLHFHSASEPSVSRDLVNERVASAAGSEIVLHESGHLPTLDYDDALIFTEAAAFLAASLPRSSPAGSR